MEPDDAVEERSEPQHNEQHVLEQEAQFLAAWGQMRQQGVQSSLRIAHEQGLSASQYNIMGLLEKMEGRAPCTIRWLSQQMGLDPATVVRAVDFLENQGMVARRRDTKDRRQVFVEFTDQGRVLQEQIHKLAADRLRTIFRSMPEEGRVALISGLRQFLTLAWRYDEGDLPRTDAAEPPDA